jgi:hypothetical protein
MNSSAPRPASSAVRPGETRSLRSSSKASLYGHKAKGAARGVHSELRASSASSSCIPADFGHSRGVRRTGPRSSRASTTKSRRPCRRSGAFAPFP